MNTYLDIPTYFDSDFINFIQKINESDNTKYKIKHVYGSITGLYSARESERLPKVTEEELQNHIKELKEINVDFYYALNTSCLGALTLDETNFIFEKLKIIKNLNVENLIIAHPFLIEPIYQIFDNPKIKISVISDINDIIRVHHFLKKKNTIINLSTSINRNFRFLESVKDYRNNLVLLANEACLFNCPFRLSHYTIESHRKNNKCTYNNYPLNKCYELMTDANLIMARFIIPEWIKIYSDYIKYIKISGRTFPRKFIQKTTYQYSIGESPENILDLFPIVTGSIHNEQTGIFEKRFLNMSKNVKHNFIKKFLDIGDQCNYICPCGICNYYSKLMITKKGKKQ